MGKQDTAAFENRRFFCTPCIYTYYTVYALLLTPCITLGSIIQFLILLYQKTDTTRIRTRNLNINWTSSTNLSVHASSCFILVQHVQIPSARVEFHCVPFDMDSVKLRTCAPTGRCATYYATQYHKELPLRLLSCNILPSRLFLVFLHFFRLSRYYCIVSLAVSLFSTFFIALVQSI